MYLRGAQNMSVLCGELADYELIKDSLDVLEIGHVASCTDDSVVANWMQTLDVLEPCQGAV